jgi:hypothetical protein
MTHATTNAAFTHRATLSARRGGLSILSLAHSFEAA